MIGSRSLRAATLAIICPGLGHAYLRSWLWSLAWFVLGVGTFVGVVGQASIDPLLAFDSPVALADRIVAETSLVDLIVLQAIVTVNVAHAYALGQLVDRAALARGDESASGTDAVAPCPACGEPLDEEIEFCHWCTYQLDEAERPDR
jgi:hypothetical protein